MMQGDRMRVREAADRLEGGWAPSWVTERRDGHEIRREIAPFPSPYGLLWSIPQEGWDSDQRIEYRFAISLPEDLEGVRTAGPLDLFIISNFPLTVRFNGRVVLEEVFPPVAAGPAKIRIVEDCKPGHVGELLLAFATRRGAAQGEMARMAAAFRFTTPEWTSAFRTLDIAAAKVELAEALAADDDERVVVEETRKALESVEVPSQRLESIEASVRRLATILSRARRYTMHCIGHSHVDLAWLWDWDDAQNVQRRDLASVVDLMQDFPEFRFTHSQAAAYKSVSQSDPSLFAEVKELIRQGRLEPATMQWVEADSNIASGPASARQLMEGVRWSEKHLDISPSVHFAPDTFGHAGNLPQLVRSAGADIYYHHRANPGSRDGGVVWPAYWWEGDDGTRLLAVSTPVYLGAISAGRLVHDFIILCAEQSRFSGLYFYGVGDHGGGPTRDDLEFIRLLSADLHFFQVRCSTIGDFRQAVMRDPQPLPVHRGESMTVFEGCYVSHSDGKTANRRGENRLTRAQALMAMAGLRPEEDFREAWQAVLLGQFHDIAGGSAIRAVYEDVRDALREVERVADIYEERAVAILSGGYTADWVAVNPTGIEIVTPLVFPEPPGGRHMLAGSGEHLIAQTTADGHTVVVAALRPFSVETFTWVPAHEHRTAVQPVPQEALNYPGQALLNIRAGRYTAQLRADSGVMTGLFDDVAGREFVAHGEGRGKVGVQARPDLGMGVLQLLDEHPHIMTSWIADEVYREQSFLRGSAPDIQEAGPVRTVVQFAHQIRNSRVELSWTFYPDIERIDYEIVLDWREQGDADTGLTTLATAFSTVINATRAVFETPFSSTTRTTNGRLVPALRWCDVGDEAAGFSVVNSGRYGHEVLGSRLRVHLARSSYDPDPVGDYGGARVRMAILPRVGPPNYGRIVSTATALNIEPVVCRPSAKSARVASAVPAFEVSDCVEVAECKPGEDGGIVLRIVELAGDDGWFEMEVPAGSEAIEVSVTERPLEGWAVGPGRQRMAMRAHEIRTLILRASES